MTVTEERRRPSPYPRLVGASDVTESESAPCTADSEDAPAERETATSRLSSLQSAITDGDAWRRWLAVAGKHFTPPSVLTERPPSVQALTRYAYHGAWTRRTIGPVRMFGVAWLRTIGLPTTVWSRYSEWIWQRPGRAIPVLLLVKLLAVTGPGAWAVEHLIQPAVSFALWLFL